MTTTIEIERKFLVAGDQWRALSTGSRQIEQGYLARGRKASIRVRISDGRSATLTIKSRQAGVSRSEFEYDIPLAHAEEMLVLCGKSRLRKRRFIVPTGDLKWEIDVFEGAHAGLVLAEIELDHAKREVELPSWIGREVTHDRNYRNETLAGG